MKIDITQPKKKPRFENTKNTKKFFKYYICGKKGHIAKNCRSKKNII